MNDVQRNRFLALGAAALLALPVMAVAADAPAKSTGTGAFADLAPTKDQKAHGTVTFERTAEGVKVVAHIAGLTPGTHGFHIHEKGDCSAPDGSSAGGHFNPTAMPHAARDAAQRHAGDLGNIEANADGVADLKVVDKQLALDGPNSIVGRGVIVHANADDLTTQPTGNAGGRVACGVVKAGDPKK